MFDLRAKQQLNRGYSDGMARGMEVVLTPLILGAFGWLLDGWLGIAPALTDRLIGGAGGFVALWAIGAGYRLVRHREGLGGGDPKLFGAIGLWLGWRLLPVVLLLAGLTGLGIVLARFLTGHKVRADDRLPLGTLLAIAAYPAWLVMLALAP